MTSILTWLIRRFRPAIGWPLALLALGAALAPAIAATTSSLALPAGLIGWSGLLGLLLGADLARPTRGRAQLLLRTVGALLLGAAGCGLLLAAAGRALPPLPVLWQDGVTLVARAFGQARPGAEPDLSARFLGESLPRLWQEILAAPTAGRAGARLITLIIALLGAWAGALVLGRAVAAGRPSLGWSLPALAATGATTILGGGGGEGLLPALALILALATATQVVSMRRGWEREGADYSDDVVPQTAIWGGVLVTAALFGALVIPVEPPAWLSNALWGQVALPSGIAAIESQVQRPRPQPRPAEIGLSQLPALALGQSLQQGPEEQLALRVTTGAPLGDSAWPRYWRARVLERYSGHDWSSAARVGAPVAELGAGLELPGGVLQEVEDLRPLRLTMVGLARVLASDTAAQAERLPDGSLAALSAEQVPARYRLLSLPPELAAPQPSDLPPPDLGVFITLPPGVPARVRELARSLTGAAIGPYDKALALERYLRELPYSYQVAPLPPAGDAVDQFLFSMGQGYCTYYASAMAVMARSLGIPARIAVGYASGEYDPEGGFYTVREAEAHAWPELYINGRWLPFEPTPVRPLPARGSQARPPPGPLPLPELPPAPARLPWGLIGGAAALAGLLAAWQIARRRAASPLAGALRRLERRGARAGRPWPAGATLREYAGLLALRNELIGRIEAATYGRQPLSTQQEIRLAHELDRVSKEIRHTTNAAPDRPSHR